MVGIKILAVGTDFKGNINIEELKKASEANNELRKTAEANKENFTVLMQIHSRGHLANSSS